MVHCYLENIIDKQKVKLPKQIFNKITGRRIDRGKIKNPHNFFGFIWGTCPPLMRAKWLENDL